MTSKKTAAENLASQLNNKLADSESERWYDRVHKFFSSWRSQNDKTISFRASVWTYKTKPNVQKNNTLKRRTKVIKSRIIRKYFLITLDLGVRLCNRKLAGLRIKQRAALLNSLFCTSELHWQPTWKSSVSGGQVCKKNPLKIKRG